MVRSHSPRALVADDSHFVRSVIGDILTEGGIDVVTKARDGREAVAAVPPVDDVAAAILDAVEVT